MNCTTSPPARATPIGGAGAPSTPRRTRCLSVFATAALPHGHRYSLQWRLQQGRRLLLLEAHQQRAEARRGLAGAGLAAAVAQPEGLPPAMPGMAAAQAMMGEALKALLSPGRPAAEEQGPADSHVNGRRGAKGRSGKGGGKGSTAAEEKGQKAAAASAPRLPKPWAQMSGKEQRAYLEAVREHHGSGQLYERRLRGGRSVLALFDDSMAAQLSGHVWREKGRGCGELYTETGPRAGRTWLAQWTAEQCLLGYASGGGRLGALGLRVASWTFRDGCPVNCLPGNLDVRLEPAPAKAAATAAPASTPAAAAAAAPAAAPAPAAAAEAEGPKPAVPKPKPDEQQARQAARAALQQLYAAVGAAEGRRFLAALHREHAAMQRQGAEAHA